MPPRPAFQARRFAIAFVLTSLLAGLVLAGPRPASGSPDAIEIDPWRFRQAEGWRDQIGGGVQGLVASEELLYAVVGARLLAYDLSGPSLPRLIGTSLPLFASGNLHHEEHSLVPEVVLAVHDRGVFAWSDVGTAHVLLAIDTTVPEQMQLLASQDLGAGSYRQLFVVGNELLDHGNYCITLCDLLWWQIRPLDQLRILAQGVLQTREDPVLIDLTDSADGILSVDRGSVVEDGAVLRWHDLDPPSRTLQLRSKLTLLRSEYWESMQLDGSLAFGMAQPRASESHPLDLVIVDVANPDDMAVQSRLPISLNLSGHLFGSLPSTTIIPFPARGAAEVVASGDYAFLPMDSGSGLRLGSVDVSDPSRPAFRGSQALHGYANELKIAGNRLFVGNPIDLATIDRDPPSAYHGVEIFDLADPANPAPIGQIHDAWNAIDVAVLGQHVVVAAALAGLRVVDASDPDQVREVAALSQIGDVTAVKRVSDQLVAASIARGPRQGLVIVDITTPDSPKILGHLPLPEHPEVVDLAISANTVVLATWDGYLHVADLRDPAAPAWSATLDVAPRQPGPLPPVLGPREPVAARAIAAEGPYGVLGLTSKDGTGNWLAVVDFSNAAAPQLVGHTPLAYQENEVRREHYDIAIDDGRVAAGAGSRIHVLELTTEGQLIFQGSKASNAYGVAWREDLLVSTHPWGQIAIDARIPERLTTVETRRGQALAAEPWRRHLGIDFLPDGSVVQAHGVQGLLISHPFVLPTPTPTETEPPTIEPTVFSTPTMPPTSTLEATPSATLLATATATAVVTLRPPSLTPSPSPSTSPSTTPSAIASPVGPTEPTESRLFLPLLLVEACPPDNLFTDVVLVIDASTSMREITADRRQKIDVAIESVRLFLNGMRLDAGKDRAAIVAFNAEANTLQTLTSDRARLDAALARIQIVAQSRVDLGIERAMVELVARGRPGQVQAMVLLSDGMVSPVPSDQAIAAAKRAQRAGITLYVVGMGPSMDARVLRELASGSERFFPAVDPLLIRRIYEDLANRVPCPPEAYWGRRQG